MRKGKLVVLAACLLTISLALSLMVLASCKKREPQPPVQGIASAAIAPIPAEKANASSQASMPKVEKSTAKPVVKEPNKTTTPIKPADVNSAAKKVLPPVEKTNMEKLLEENWFWKQIGKEWYGTRVPDVNLTDIDGKHHKISDYRGKDIIVLSFTWWCPGSEAQVKYFMIELRKEISENELGILGIAAQTPYNNDSLEKLKEFIAKYKVNFPVCYITPEATPAPFNSNMNVPCTYFIDRNGVMKLAIQDIITIKDLKRVLKAMQ